MRELRTGIMHALSAARTALSGRNRRVTLAVVLGGVTIAAANWLAMSQPPGASVFGLSSGKATGAVFAPAYGGLVTGLVLGISRRPVYADGRAGTFAAFAGMLMLVILVGFARVTDGLPDAGTGFERFGPVSGTVFVLVVGSVNVFVTFPVAFTVMFISRSIIPNNQHRYGWLIDDTENPGLDYVTPGPDNLGRDLSRHSTAFSRFAAHPPRFSDIPARFRDAEPG